MSSASPAAARTCTVDLTLDLSAPRVSRHLIDLLLPQWGVTDRDLIEAAALVVSELVTHALVGSVDGGPATVGVELAEEQLRLWVLDRSADVSLPRPSTGSAEDARGLLVVGQIATRWGIEREPEGRRAYAEVPLLAAPVP